MAAKAGLGGVVAPADKGLVIRIGDKETARRRNTEKYTWVRIVMISDTHNKCVARMQLSCSCRQESQAKRQLTNVSASQTR